MLFTLLAVVLTAATAGLLMSPWPVLALVPGPAAVGGALLLRRPELALYATVFLIPFGAFRKIGGVDLPWVLAAFLIAMLALRLAVDRRFPEVAASPLWPWLLAYFGVATVAAALSPFPDVARHEVFLTAVAFSFILLAMAFLTREGYRAHMPRVLAWSISIGSFLGVLGGLFGIGVFAETTPTGEVMDRTVGGAIDPNNQSAMILFCLPVVVHLALFAESPRERLVMTGLLGINVLGLLLTQSRGGFLAGVLTAGVLVVHHRHLLHPKRLGLFVAGGALGLLALLAVAPPDIFERQTTLVEWEEDRSLSRRSSYLGVAWDAFLERPALGSGPGTFREHYARSDVTRLYSLVPERQRREAHNTYLEFLVGTGVIGLALWLGALAWALGAFRRAERAFAARGDHAAADLTAAYRIGFAILLLFLLMLSDTYHKYMLLGLALAQAAVFHAGVLGEKRSPVRATGEGLRHTQSTQAGFPSPPMRGRRSVNLLGTRPDRSR